MAISQVIKYEGSPDDLVWKYSGEEFNATSQLLVDETYQAILVVNGQAADLFGAGRHTLTVPNIPIVQRIINIPTGGNSPFQCKVFYVNQVHQMDMLWGTRGPITLNDPLFEIFLHVMLHGSMSFSIADSRKFLIKLCGFRSRYTKDEMLNNFKGIISSHVKDCISQIMINGMLSYFMINAKLFEISGVVKERLDTVFDEYGIRIEFFNIETIEVPKEDYEAVSKARERRSGRIIEGYTWQEERQMMIAEKFAGNEGTMGNIGGAVGGFMMGSTMSGSIADIARSALSQNNIPTQAPPSNTSGIPSPMGGGSSAGFDVRGFLNSGGNPPQPPQPPVQQPAQPPVQQPAQPPVQQPAQPPVQQPVQPPVQQPAQPPVQQPASGAPAGGKICPECGCSVTASAKFCNECGHKFEVQSFCPECGTKTPPGAKFCNECGTRLS